MLSGEKKMDKGGAGTLGLGKARIQVLFQGKVTPPLLALIPKFEA